VPEDHGARQVGLHPSHSEKTQAHSASTFAAQLIQRLDDREPEALEDFGLGLPR
jgi:hypothetical protein